MSVSFFAVSFFTGRLVAARGPRLAITGGMTLTGLGFAGLAAAGADTSLTRVMVPLLVVGVGLGLITGPIANAAVTNVATARAGMASGLVNVGRLVGATFGVGVLGLVFGASTASLNADGFVAGMRAALLMGAAAQFLGAAIAFLCFRGASRSEAAPPVSALPARSVDRVRSTAPRPRARGIHRASD
jgi:MFS family permease